MEIDRQRGCSCLSAAKTLLRAPRPSKSCISIEKQYNLFRRRPCWPSTRTSPSSSTEFALAGGSKNCFPFSLFLHRRDTFHRRSIGYSELEVVAASSQRQSEFLCAEACHTPIEDAIFWRASQTRTWKIQDLESTFYTI